jgi:ASC-1-like (ASCH) protein
MRKSWRLTENILSGEKRIESRWYMTRYPPYDNIKPGDTIYFKDSGCPVTIKTKVGGVKQFQNLTPEKVKEILNTYSQKDGLGIDDIPKYFEMFKRKKYCIIVFIKGAEAIKPFHINKKGYGAMASWLCLNNINDVKC